MRAGVMRARPVVAAASSDSPRRGQNDPTSKELAALGRRRRARAAGSVDGTARSRARDRRPRSSIRDSDSDSAPAGNWHTVSDASKRTALPCSVQPATGADRPARGSSHGAAWRIPPAWASPRLEAHAEVALRQRGDLVGVQNAGSSHAVRRSQLDLCRQSSDVRSRQHDGHLVQVVDRLVCVSARARVASANRDGPPGGLRRASPGLVPGRLLLVGRSPHRLRATRLVQPGEVAHTDHSLPSASDRALLLDASWGHGGSTDSYAWKAQAIPRG
jgi:hypothetical protein